MATERKRFELIGWRRLLPDIVKSVGRTLLRVANRLIPKKSRMVLFYSEPDFAGNARAVYDALTENGDYTAVWLVREPEMVVRLKTIGCAAYAKGSLAGLWAILRSRTIITTHLFPSTLKCSNQVVINVWHGVPLKAMGYTSVPGEDAAFELAGLARAVKRTDIMITTSTIARNAMTACFGIDSRRVLVTGQPRNDRLFVSRESARERLHETLGIDHKTLASKRTILWAPTFRDWAIHQRRGVFDLSALLTSFSEHLEHLDAILVVKPHGLMGGQKVSQCANVWSLTDDVLSAHLVDLYDFLPAMDLLVTDYSSIYFDYLLLDRPIVFFCPDLEEYVRHRGLVLEPYEFWTPGPKTFSIDHLATEIDKSLDNPEYFSGERATANNLINAFKDDQSSKRVVQLVHSLTRMD